MSDESHSRWPLDLRIFAVIFLLWAAQLALRAFFGAHPGSTEQFQDVVFGLKLYDNPARVAMAVQALIFAAFSIGILLRMSWALLLACIYWTYVGASQILFMVIYFHDDSQRGHVYNAEVLLPIMLSIVFYLWFRRRSLPRRA
ncbi:MAG: hypothetical protein ACREQR_11055 [Candidatus Binataceae bacterium]